MVTSIVDKVLELLRNLISAQLSKTQSPLQAGFTSGASPLNAAFVIQEAIADSKMKRKPLYVALLNAKTTFDVVSHNSLNRKLYIDRIHGDLWQLIVTYKKTIQRYHLKP
jgi:hypothetical protein